MLGNIIPIGKPIFITIGIILGLVGVISLYRAQQIWDQDKPDPLYVKPLRKRGYISLIFSLLCILAGIFIPVPTQCNYTAKIQNYSGPFQCVPGTITIDGSTALKPLVEAAAQSYENSCPAATINFGSKEGSLQGIQDVEKEYVDIGDSDIIAPPSSGYDDLVDNPVAAIVFVMVVNPSVHIQNLSTEQIQDIYKGTYTDWSQLGLAPQPIVAYTRDATSGSWSTFSKYVLLGQPDNATPAPTPTPSSVNTSEQSSSGDTSQDMIDAVEANKGAIGYAASSTAEVEANAGRLNIININGYSPHSDLGKYRFWNIEHMYTKSDHTTPLTTAFINYMRDPKNINPLISSLGYIQLSEVVDLLNDHCPI